MNNETRTLSLITQLVTTEGKTLNITVYVCYGPLILKKPNNSDFRDVQRSVQDHTGCLTAFTDCVSTCRWMLT